MHGTFFLRTVKNIYPYFQKPPLALKISGYASESQQKIAKKEISFYNTVFLKKIAHFTNLNLLNIIINILPQPRQKHVSGWCQKNHLHCNSSRCSRTVFLEHLESRCLYIPVTFGSFCFRDVRSSYLVLAE